MELTPRQLSSLKEMGIPVWEFRSTEAEQAVFVDKQLASTEPSEKLLNCDWVVLIDGQNYSEQAQRLLHAMLFAIGIEQNQVVIIDSEQLTQLQNMPRQRKVLIVLSEVIAKSLLGESVIRGSVHQTLNSQISTVVSFGLDELLENPENKALAWQDLQLAKQALVQ
ncbi:MAG: hypothetical protein GQ548_05850 [Methylophaga sp.]|nr:hypothetical protein [Methylophaga sp.]